jgi:NodT family efflux transporter outer membrane factor (OMF) lipoprotein
MKIRPIGRKQKYSSAFSALSAVSLKFTAMGAARLTLLGIVAAALLASAGCTVGPDYVRPAAEIPWDYKETPGWKKATPQDHAVGGAWWELFQDAELSGLMERVIVSNQNVAVAEAQFRQARALARAARAGYFPTVTGGASQTRSSRSTTLISELTSRRTTLSDYLLPIDLSWEVDVWGRVRRLVEAGRAGAEASAADLRAALLIAQAELALDYFQLRVVDEQRQLFDETIRAFRKTLDLTLNRYARGVASRADVLLAETQLKAAEAQAIDLGVQRSQMEHAVAMLIGKPASLFSLPAAPLRPTMPVIPVGVPSELLERRPDIAAAERTAAAANAQIGVAMAAYFPKITLSASFGFESADSWRWLTAPSRFWSVGPALAETLFDGGLRGAQTEQARAAYDAAVASYRQTVLTGFQEVEDQLAALRVLEEETTVQEDALRAARLAVTITLNRYKAGTASTLDVLVAQTTALDRERAVVDILGRRLTASVLLIKALGGGWE